MKMPLIVHISTFLPQAGMQFNQFLIRDEEPLLYDLFHQNGDVEPLTGNSMAERCRELLKNYQQSPFADYIPYSPAAERVLQNLAALYPKTLATMHVSSFSGDGNKAIKELAQVWERSAGLNGGSAVPFVDNTVPVSKQ